MIQNKIPFSFFARGFPENTIDPRAGRLEVATRSKVAVGVNSYSEFRPLQKCDREYLEIQIDFVETV